MKLKDITRLNKLEVGMKVYGKYDLKIIEGWKENISDILFSYGYGVDPQGADEGFDEHDNVLYEAIVSLLTAQAKISYQQGVNNTLLQISKIPKIEFTFSDVQVALTKNNNERTKI